MVPKYVGATMKTKTKSTSAAGASGEVTKSVAEKGAKHVC